MTDPAVQSEPSPCAQVPAEGSPELKPKMATPDADTSSAEANAGTNAGPAPRWPFAAGSQNQTDKAVKLKPYVPPKRRGLNQY